MKIKHWTVPVVPLNSRTLTSHDLAFFETLFWIWFRITYCTLDSPSLRLYITIRDTLLQYTIYTN